MNLVEHYIVEVHGVKDVTDEFAKHCGYEPSEPMLKVDLTYDCYGSTKRAIEHFWQSNWETAKKTGYFMA